jgi:hypothetical protein
MTGFGAASAVALKKRHAVAKGRPNNFAIMEVMLVF